MNLKLDRQRMAYLWRRGGNWLTFLLCWVVSAAIIGAIESSAQNRELIEETAKAAEAQAMEEMLLEVKTEINDTEVRAHLDQLVTLMKNAEFSRVWGLAESRFDDHVEVLRMKMKLLRDEFTVVRAALPPGDREGRQVADRLVTLLTDNRTLAVFDQVAQHSLHLAEAAAQEREVEEDWEHFSSWEIGGSLHYVSTIFTTIGYGATTPTTSGGKFLTILMVVTLIPFFLHCLCSSAADINTLIDSLLGVSSQYDDLEDLTAEDRASNSRARREARWKGAMILLGVVTAHLFLSSLYHLATTGWNYGDVSVTPPSTLLSLHIC